MFNPQEFINNLPYMAKGMVAIIVVIAVIILVTTLLNKFTGGKKDK